MVLSSVFPVTMVVSVLTWSIECSGISAATWEETYFLVSATGRSKTRVGQSMRADGKAIFARSSVGFGTKDP